MARYGRKAQEKVRKAMHERKRGTLRSGSSGRKVKSRKQAIAIGLSEARRAGGKVPSKSTGSRTRARGSRKSAARGRTMGGRSRARATSSRRKTSSARTPARSRARKG